MQTTAKNLSDVPAINRFLIRVEAFGPAALRAHERGLGLDRPASRWHEADLWPQVKPTDDELAQVLGHEIAHALANHSAEKMSVAIASTIGVAAVGVAAKRKGLALTGAALAAALAVQRPNSRTAESEADRIGIELAARAGYDPRAAITLWQKMAKVGGKGPPEFLSTHPSPQNREKKLAELVPQMMPYYEQKGKRPRHELKG